MLRLLSSAPTAVLPLCACLLLSACDAPNGEKRRPLTPRAPLVAQSELVELPATVEGFKRATLRLTTGRDSDESTVSALGRQGKASSWCESQQISYPSDLKPVLGKVPKGTIVTFDLTCQESLPGQIALEPGQDPMDAITAAMDAMDQESDDLGLIDMSNGDGFAFWSYSLLHKPEERFSTANQLVGRAVVMHSFDKCRGGPVLVRSLATVYAPVGDEDNQAAEPEGADIHTGELFVIMSLVCQRRLPPNGSRVDAAPGID